MKIAIFQDYIDQTGGAERIALQLARKLDATIITPSLDREKVVKMGFADVKIIQLPLLVSFSQFKPLFIVLAFAFCDFSKDFDYFIINGRWSIFAARKHKPNLYICVDILREFYDLKDFYYRELSFFLKSLLFLGNVFLKPVFEMQLNELQKITVLSKIGKKRIKEYYKRDSEVIYAPIDCRQYSWKKSKGYWLSVNRLYPFKRIELQFEAFKLLPEKKLIIVGDYAKGDEALGYVKRILETKPENVEIVKPLEIDLNDLYSRCEGFVATSKGEMLGMAVIEAMASGKPVVCVDEGGFRETVVDGKTGFLVKANPKELVNAIKKVSRNPEKFKNACIKQAKKFDSGVFFKKIKKIMEA